VKEARAERALEPGDPAAHRRSWHTEHICSCPKVPKLSDPYEKLDGSDLDCPTHRTHYPTAPARLKAIGTSIIDQRKEASFMGQKLTVVVTGGTGKQARAQDWNTLLQGA
jgi:hypothetical protein